MSLAVLLVILASGLLVVKSFRDRTDEDRQTASELLTKFREMHHDGDISESEFRTIKTVLGQKLHEEFSDGEDEDSSLYDT